MTKMEGIAAEISQKLKSAIKAKLKELEAYVDDELSNYVMVMVTNRRSKDEMDRELQLFLGANTSAFTSWLQSVWQKLEQVTVTNSGIDSKRKPSDKKKKAKKSSKSSSESEDDKKHKKKRKSSASDTVSKDVKKRKLQSKELDLPKESKKKDDAHTQDRSSSDSEDLGESTKNPPKDGIVGSANEEDDFLNIKEEFESGFLSDTEYSELTTKTKSSTTAEPKKPTKTDLDVPPKMITLKRDAPANTKETTVKTRNSTEAVNSKRSASESKPSVVRKPLLRDYKNRSSPPKLKSRHRSPLSPTNSHSRSKSPSQSKIIQLKRRVSGTTSGDDVNEDFNTKIQRSRLKSVTAGCGSTIIVKSRSRSRSPLTTKRLSNREVASQVMDARELINRKRAMCMVNEPATKEKSEFGIAKTTTAGGKIIRIRDRERSKENCRVEDEISVIVDDDYPEEGEGDPKMGKNGGKSVISRGEGKRSVVVQKATSPTNSRRADLRGIKRTVYVDEDSAEDEDDSVDKEDEVETIIDPVDEKIEKKKKFMKQLVKYITPEKTVASTVVKLPKPPRPKTSPSQSASSTLIRKAMADAHKSLTNSKDDAKKKETSEKSVRERFREENAIKTEVSDEEDEENKKEVDNQDDADDDDEKLSVKSTKSAEDAMEDAYDENENMDEGVNPTSPIEEYEPSISTPQFVVTLTGLDSKLFPEQDNDLLMDSLNDDLEADMEDLEEVDKSKPKPQERCKYYPNCLAGDQCLFYHPTIPCKLFPNCKFGSNCLYIHPKCKFDSMCTRYDCTFTHTTTRGAPIVPPRHAPPPAMMTAQPCKFYYNCVNPVCPFQHPKICRFDRFCTNKNCTFSHTSLTHVSMVSKDKLKWSRPKDTNLKTDNDNEMSVQ